MDDGDDPSADSGPDSMDAAEASITRTPRDAGRDGPMPAEHVEHRLRGPPAPQPVHGPPLETDPATGEQERETATTAAKANAERRLTPARRPAPLAHASSDSSSSEDSGESEEGDARAPAAPEHEPDDGSPAGWWFDTSYILEDEALDAAREEFVNLFRRQLREEQPDLSSRSTAARVGALRRSLSGTPWPDIQGLSTQRLHGIYLREWTQYEFRATHTYHTGRSIDEEVP